MRAGESSIRGESAVQAQLVYDHTRSNSSKLKRRDARLLLVHLRIVAVGSLLGLLLRNLLLDLLRHILVGESDRSVSRRSEQSVELRALLLGVDVLVGRDAEGEVARQSLLALQEGGGVGGDQADGGVQRIIQLVAASNKRRDVPLAGEAQVRRGK